MRLVTRSHRLAATAALALVTTALAAGPASASVLNAGGPLPDTGSSVQWWLIAAIAVLVVGGGLFAYSRWSGKSGGQ